MNCLMEYKTEALGTLTLSSNGEAITGLWLEGQKYFLGNLTGAEFKQDNKLACFDRAQQWLDSYFAGEPQPLETLLLAPQGTAFQQRVWKLLAKIPYGTLTTYGALAQELAVQEGKEKQSARAVGGAVGRNPISIILPCHRVVGASGSVTGYAGGIDRKLWLLEHEGVDVARLSIPTKGTAL